VIKIVQGHS